MSEAQLVLQAIHERLEAEPVDIASPLTLEEGLVTLLAGDIELRVEVQHDEGAHPAIAHAHVLVTMGDDEEPLDASVVAVHPDRARALAAVGHTFCDLVAGPVLSMGHGRPVLGALPFDGRTPNANHGIGTGHGYIGPRAVRGLADGAPDPFAGLPSFEFATALAPPRLTHIAKAVFDVRADQRIRRTLEVDGHTASHVDAPWHPEREAPANIIGLHFAVFRFGEPGPTAKAHRGIDEAIEAFVEHFAATRDRDAAADQLAASGVAPALVHELRLFVPAAFARVVFGDGLPLSPTFTRVRRDGWTDEGVPFMGERPFARALVTGRARLETHEAIARALALASSEVGAIHHALEAGTPLDRLQPLPPLVPDPDVPLEVLERVAQQLYGEN